MPNPWGLPGEMPVPRLCTAMHSVGSCRRGLISVSDCTQTSKCPYMDTFNPGQTHKRRRDSAHIGGYSGCTFTRCTLMHNSAPKPSGVIQ